MTCPIVSTLQLYLLGFCVILREVAPYVFRYFVVRVSPTDADSPFLFFTTVGSPDSPTPLQTATIT